MLSDNLKEWYGEDQIEVIKVDGSLARDISGKYGIESYPKLMVIYPNSDGNTMNIFKEKERTFETMKYWALSHLTRISTKPQYKVTYEKPPVAQQ